MDKKEIREMMLDLISPLYKWLGPKQILIILAEFEEKRSLANRAIGIYWDAKHNAGLLRDTAKSMRE